MGARPWPARARPRVAQIHALPTGHHGRSAGARPQASVGARPWAAARRRPTAGAQLLTGHHGSSAGARPQASVGARPPPGELDASPPRELRGSSTAGRRPTVGRRPTAGARLRATAGARLRLPLAGARVLDRRRPDPRAGGRGPAWSSARGCSARGLVRPRPRPERTAHGPSPPHPLLPSSSAWEQAAVGVEQAAQRRGDAEQWRGADAEEQRRGQFFFVS